MTEGDRKIRILMTRSDATSDDKEALEAIKMMLTGKDASDVEKDLASGIVKQSTLDKIEKIDKDIVDTCLEHIPMKPLVREFWKQFLHIQIDQNKRSEEMRLKMLQIPIVLIIPTSPPTPRLSHTGYGQQAFL